MSQSPITSTTPEALRAAIAEAVQVDAQQLQAAVGSIQVASSEHIQRADIGDQIQSLYNSKSRTLTLLADRIPAGQEAQAFTTALAFHFGSDVATELVRQEITSRVFAAEAKSGMTAELLNRYYLEEPVREGELLSSGWTLDTDSDTVEYFRRLGGSGTPFVTYDLTVRSNNDGSWTPIHGSVAMPPEPTSAGAANTLMTYWRGLSLRDRLTAENYAQLSQNNSAESVARSLAAQGYKPGEWGTSDGSPAITWWRYGVAARGEPSFVQHVQKYASDAARIASYQAFTHPEQSLEVTPNDEPTAQPSAAVRGIQVSQSELSLLRAAVENYRDLLSSPTSADRSALGDDWADDEVKACDTLLKSTLSLSNANESRVDSPSPSM